MSQNEKIVRLIQYLLRLATLRSKLIRDIGNYEKSLWISSVPNEQGCFTQAWGSDEEHESDEWIVVKNPQEPALPAVPVQCTDWVNQAALRNTGELPELLPQITRQVPNPAWREGTEQPETISSVERIEDHPNIQRAWDRYIEEKWLPWTELHNTWEKVHNVYSSFFAIHQEQVRLGEEYELVLGLGLLIWQTSAGQRVRRHLIVADVVLEFKARLGQFTVRPHTEGAKLRPELDMLDIEEQPAHAEETAKSALSSADDDPWNRECVEGVLQALVHSLNANGVYNNALDAQGIQAAATPTVVYAPALILRKRSAKGLTETLKRIEEQVENSGRIPSVFADLAEVRCPDDPDQGEGRGHVNTGFGGEIFFPKPSNDEQRRIVDMMRAANGVLVQGPPGTGKSHTIANLICHLLATGQRTLITAKTPRALQVLEGLVPNALRPLCINLLGSGIEERRSLESSVGGILREQDAWNEQRVTQKCAELEETLRTLREEKARISRRLRDIRESETHTQSIAEGAYRGTAARIAEAVSRDRAAYGWFLDAAPLEQSCQISADDLRIVLDALRRFTPEQRRELDLVWPGLDALPSTEGFAGLVQNETSAIEEQEASTGRADEHFADLLANNNPATIVALRDALSIFRDTRTRLTAIPHPWMDDAVRDILGGNSTLWHKLLSVTRDAIASVGEYVAAADETRIEFPDDCDIRVLCEDTIVLKKHMENGGKLGWGLFRPSPVKERLYVIKSVKIGGRPCLKAEHFATLATALHVRIECEKVWDFWAGRSDRAPGPYVLQLGALKSLGDALENALSLEGIIGKCREAIERSEAVEEPLWADASQVEEIILCCRLALARIRRRSAAEAIQRVEIQASTIAARDNAHPVAGALLGAIRNRNVDGFAQCTDRIQNLDKERRLLRSIEAYLEQLRCLLPRLVDCLTATCNEPCWEERIQHIGDAWHWAQARYWIEEHIRQEDVPALARRAKQIEDELNGTIAELASLHAWSSCFSRLQDEQHRHMVAWQQAMRRLGRGTGRQAHHFRLEAQRHLDQCREAVPAWVMPLHRVWDTVAPKPGMFDVIVIDEASQCGVEALPLFYLGRKILIVGDDRQISPDAVGIPRDAVRHLMREFLYDFEFKDSFDVESSLFDHGKLRYGTRHITLREHFRCMPEIIQFSNDLCYADTPLVPLRQYGPNRLPPLEHVFVPEGYREGTNNRVINRPEAEAIVTRIAELCADERYAGMSIGVIVLQGEAQATLIENTLLERLGAEEMERRRLVCGNPYSFQGDERDIMFLSLVAATNETIGTLTKPADERRFNVAASRARDRMILFHSVTCDDLSPNCLRRRLLDFFENTRPQQIAGIDREELERRAAQDNRLLVRPPAPFESWFEVDVALELLRRNFVVLSQYEVAGKRIDLVVEGGQRRLAVECDGDRWHGADRYEDDMQRQRQLERCGWEFFRVRESAFYLNRDDALKRLWQSLEERGICPQSAGIAEEAHISTPVLPDEVAKEEPQESEPASPRHEPEKDITVTVGDTVVYVDIEHPQAEKQAFITRGISDPGSGAINFNTPLARALIGARLGSTVEATLPRGRVSLLIRDIRKPRPL